MIGQIMFSSLKSSATFNFIFCRRNSSTEIKQNIKNLFIISEHPVPLSPQGAFLHLHQLHQDL